MACRLLGAIPLSEPIVNLIFRNKLQWNSNPHSYIFIQENAFENISEMSAILSRPRCVKKPHFAHKGEMWGVIYECIKNRPH